MGLNFFYVLADNFYWKNKLVDLSITFLRWKCSFYLMYI